MQRVQPFLTWQVVAAQFFAADPLCPKARDLTNKIVRMPCCCTDASVTEKIIGKKQRRKPVDAILLHKGLECMRLGAAECYIVNLDEERDLSYFRSLAFGDQQKLLSTIVNIFFCQRVRRQHELSGGVTVAGSTPTTKAINAHKLALLQKKQRKDICRIPQTLNGWVLFFRDNLLPHWRKQQAEEITQVSVGGRRVIKKKVGRETTGEDWQTKIVLGMGTWDTYISFI